MLAYALCATFAVMTYIIFLQNKTVGFFSGASQMQDDSLVFSLGQMHDDSLVSTLGAGLQRL